MTGSSGRLRAISREREREKVGVDGEDGAVVVGRRLQRKNDELAGRNRGIGGRLASNHCLQIWATPQRSEEIVSSLIERARRRMTSRVRGGLSAEGGKTWRKRRFLRRRNFEHRVLKVLGEAVNGQEEEDDEVFWTARRAIGRKYR